jgi:hypothetical protein
MKLTFLGTDSVGGSCPTLYTTDRGTIVVQGNRVTDTEALTQLRDALEGEAFVEVPIELGKHWPSAVGPETRIPITNPTQTSSSAP